MYPPKTFVFYGDYSTQTKKSTCGNMYFLKVTIVLFCPAFAGVTFSHLGMRNGISKKTTAFVIAYIKNIT